MHIKPTLVLAAMLSATQVSAEIVNISTRGYVDGVDKEMIAGFIIDGENAQKVLVGVLGASLEDFGVTDVLADPKLTVFDAAGEVIAENDDWGNDSEVAATKYAPTDDKEAAMVTTLDPGSYTIHASGVGDTAGNAIVLVQHLETIEPEPEPEPEGDVLWKGTFVETISSSGLKCNYDVDVIAVGSTNERVTFSLTNSASDGCPVSKTSTTSGSLPWVNVEQGGHGSVSVFPRTNDSTRNPIPVTATATEVKWTVQIHVTTPFPQYISVGVLELNAQ